jgi:hypothetical protein
MATDINIPVYLPESAAEYISQYGQGTAAVYLAYGSASPPTDGTASQLLTSGVERYDFWVTTAANSYFQASVGDGTATGWTSEVWQAPNAYCTLEEVLRGMDFPDTSRYDELEALTVEATDHITNVVCGGRSFFRDPVGSGTTTKTFDITVPGQSLLSLARGRRLDIQSVTSMTVAEYTGATASSVAMSTATGAYLVPDVVASGTPYSDIVLADTASTYTTFPVGRRVVAVTGVFGWAAVPELVRRATVDLVRFWWNDRSGDGQPVGMSAFGSPVFGAGMPKTVRDLGRSDYAWKDWIA